MSDLVRQHHVLLYRYAYRLSGSAADAEDLTQETYLKACRKIGQLREPNRAKSWLCSILRDLFLKRIRDADEVQVDSRLVEVAPGMSEPELHAGEFDSDDLQTALDQLPEQFRTPVILYFFEEFTYKEIAAQMEVPVGTVMSRLARGKAHLRSFLANTGQQRLSDRERTDGLSRSASVEL